ncbi:glycosyltransferase family 2 protein [Mycobacterium montefiorense]|uniref:glycosyltransferase family 2 protein n=1 Tax=Mycobacterium montefiorense TaxID=154654 RepID=UPI0021F2DA7E|nr:glycosyltransferase family A protein [Mycobacterium montefiorense]
MEDVNVNGQVRISIGIPVYNGEASLEQALRSIDSQSFHDYEVIISDNASTDNTAQICREMAAINPRVKYFRQENNIGAAANFKFVLDKAVGEYFHWLAADDTRSSNFLELNINFLDENVDHVASTCPNRFKGQAEADNVTFSLVGTPAERFASFMDHCWQSQAVYYSVVRTAILRQCDVIGQSFWAVDWAIDLFLASRGNINRTDDGWLELGVSGASSGADAWRVLRSGRIEAVLPFFTFSAHALKLAKPFPLADRLSLLSRLVVLNWRGAYGKAFTALYQRYKAGLRPMRRGN